jgi:hypothetical protein
MYALIENGAVTRYPYTVTDLRLANPGTSFPNQPSDETLVDFGLHRVAEVAAPQVQSGQVAVEGTPVLVTGQWTQVWTVRTKNDAEIAAEMQTLQNSIVQATQDRLDAFARTRHYDDIKSASGYAGCAVPKFNIEGTYCRDARAETWVKLYDMMAEVQAGTRPMPTGFADVESELPVLVWPN